MGRIGRLLIPAGAAFAALMPAAALAVAADEDASSMRCYAADRQGAVFYSSAAYQGTASHADGDYFAFTAELTHRYRIDVDEESGACIADAAERGAGARIDAAWRPYRDGGKRRVDTGWRPERVRR